MNINIAIWPPQVQIPGYASMHETRKPCCQEQTTVQTDKCKKKTNHQSARL